MNKKKQNWVLNIIIFCWLIFVPFSTLNSKNSVVKSIKNYSLYHPEKLAANIPLSNPGIGIEQASLLESRTGKSEPTYSGLVGPRNTSLNNVSTIRYIRSDWVSLAPAKDQYHWTTLDNSINDAWSKGQQIGFSINCASPVISNSYWQNVPTWFINDPRHIKCTGPNTPEGCTYYEIDFTRCSTMGEGADCYNNFGVNHDDSIFIKAQLDLIEAIRLRYDNKEWAAKWAYIDMRNWGVWGEWQTDEARISGTSFKWPHPSLENKKAIIDAYLKFEHIPVIANYHDEVSWLYAIEQGAILGKTVGWRTDGIDVTAWKINPAINKYNFIKNSWKTGPIYGEVMGSTLSSEEIKNTVLPRAYLWNMSGFNNKWENKYTSDLEYKNLIDEFRARGGYRLAIDEVMMPEVLSQDDTFSVVVKINNSGIAPLYRKYYKLSIKVASENGGNEEIIHLPGDITKILPDQTASFTINNLKLPFVGDYSISVGITGDETYNPAPLPVTLANSGSSANGDVHWCYVGKIKINATTALKNLNTPSELGLYGDVKVYSIQGRLVGSLHSKQSLENWFKVNNFPAGTYIINDENNNSKQICISN